MSRRRYREPAARLARACAEAHAEGVREALACGADVDGARDAELTPLQVCVRAGFVEGVRVLRRAGADPQLRRFSHSALHDAVLARRREMLDAMLGSGRRLKQSVIDETAAFAIGQTLGPRGYAVAALEVFMDHGVHPSRPLGERGWTLLHQIAAEGAGEQVARALARGARPEVLSRDRRPYPGRLRQSEEMSALARAAHADNPQTLRVMLEHPRRRWRRHREVLDRALEAAVTRGSAACAELLLSWGADPNASTPGAGLMLAAAAARADVDLVEVLLAHGADPRARGAVRRGLGWRAWRRRGHSHQGPRRDPMVCAVEADAPGVIRALARAGAPLDEALYGRQGDETPLVVGVAGLRDRAVAALIERGADVDVRWNEAQSVGERIERFPDTYPCGAERLRARRRHEAIAGRIRAPEAGERPGSPEGPGL